MNDNNPEMMMTELTGKILAILLTGTTHYVDVGKGTDAVIYYATPTEAHMTLPDGPTWAGAWSMTGAGYTVAWNGGPTGEWKIGYETGVFTYIGPDGKPAGTITKIVPGNPEKF